jgi:hypothetical protein
MRIVLLQSLAPPDSGALSEEARARAPAIQIPAHEVAHAFACDDAACIETAALVARYDTGFPAGEPGHDPMLDVMPLDVFEELSSHGIAEQLDIFHDPVAILVMDESGIRETAQRLVGTSVRNRMIVERPLGPGKGFDIKLHPDHTVAHIEPI